MPEHFGEAPGRMPVRQRHPRAVPPDQIGRIGIRQKIGIGADESIKCGPFPGCSHPGLHDQRYCQKRRRNQSAHRTPSGTEKNTGLSPFSIWPLKWIKMAAGAMLEAAQLRLMRRGAGGERR